MRTALRSAPARLLSVLLTAFVLWKGGKSIDATWILAGIGGASSFLWWAKRRRDAAQDMAPVSLAWIAAIAFLLWSIAAYAQSSARNYGLDEILRDAAGVLLFFWVTRARRDGAGASLERTILGALAVATLAACAIGVIVYALQPVDRFVGTFFDHRFRTDYWPNAWAEYLLLAWPVTLLALRQSRLVARRPLAIGAILGFIIGCLLLSYSRGAFLCLVGQCALTTIAFAPSFRWRSGEAWKHIALGAAGLAVMAGATFVAANAWRGVRFPVQSVADKATFQAAEGRSSIDERSAFWDTASSLARRRPMFGWGPYSFRFAQPYDQSSVLATADHPHNVFLKVAMERGAPALIFFTLLLVAVLVPAAWKTLRSSRAATEPLTVTRLLLIGVAGVLAHNLIDYNLQFVGIAAPLWCVLGLLAAQARPRTRTRLLARLRRTVELLLATLLLVVAILEGRYLVLSSLGRHAEADGDAVAALEWYAASDGEWFSRDLRLSRAGLQWKAGDPAGALRTLDAYQAENALDARAWSTRGALRLSLGDNPTAAREAVERAYAGGRYNDVSTVTSLLRLLRGSRTSLTARRPEFDKLFTDYADAILKNTHFIALSDNVERFAEMGEEMARAYPDGAARYRAAVAKSVQHAKTERERFAQQPRALLW